MKIESEEKENKSLEMKKELELKIFSVTKENKIISQRVKYLENKIDEINNDNKQAYDLLLVKYREALDINLHFIFEIK